MIVMIVIISSLENRHKMFLHELATLTLMSSLLITRMIIVMDDTIMTVTLADSN